MARKVNRLSAIEVQKLSAPGMYPDGAGLYLLIGPGGAKSWALRYMLAGRARYMGLGPVHTITLREARQRAQDARRLKLDGIDPLEARRASRAGLALEQARAISFAQAAGQYIEAHRAGWRNEKHAAQWTATLDAYAYPKLGKLPVAAVDTGLVTQVLRPIWTTKPETASRVRGRIEAILDYATTHGWREGPNPARWKGHLDNVLPARGKVAKVQHHAALDWRQIGAFVADLDKQPGVAALALRFLILTAARTGEVIGATWAEIDLAAGLWTVPADRMKAGREHRVPLSADALAVLREAAELRADASPGAPLFPGAKRGQGLSNMALLVLLRRMGRGDLTAHGFRSTFRDWAGETGKPVDLAEAALAHTGGDKTVQAYARGDLLDRRRRLMSDWAAWCAAPAPAAGANVTPLHAGAA